MHTYLLFVLITGYQGKGNATTSMEFATEKACLVAKSQVMSLKIEKFTKLTAQCLRSY